MQNHLQYSKSGLALTERFEGCRLEAYPDPGTGDEPWTIGFGHTRGVFPGMVCTEEQAVAFLQQDVAFAVNAVNELVQVQLNQDEFDALVDFVFNIGTTAFRCSTLLRLLNAGDIAGASEQFARWDIAGGHVMAGLLNRRLAEKSEFVQGATV